MIHVPGLWPFCKSTFDIQFQADHGRHVRIESCRKRQVLRFGRIQKLRP